MSELQDGANRDELGWALRNSGVQPSQAGERLDVVQIELQEL